MYESRSKGIAAIGLARHTGAVSILAIVSDLLETPGHERSISVGQALLQQAEVREVRVAVVVYVGVEALRRRLDGNAGTADARF